MSDESSHASDPSTRSSTVTSLLGVLVAIIAAAAMKVAATVLIPLVLAVFLCYLLAPLMAWLARRRVPEVLTLPIALILLLGAVVLLHLLVIQTIDQIAERAPFYAERVQDLVARVLEMLGTQAASVVVEVNWVAQLSGAASDLTVSIFGGVINFVAKLVLVTTYTLFILLGRKSLANNLSRALSKERAEEMAEILVKVNLQVQRYIVAKILLSFATGLCMYLALLAWGVDFAIFWGLLGFLLNFIPTVGSAIAALLPISLSLLQFDSLLRVLGVAVSLIAIQQIIGNLIEPAVQGKRLNLSPIVVLFALVFFGWLWGFWGMVLSVPMMAVFKIGFEHSKPLKPIAILLEK